MKKLLIITLAVLLAISAAGCSKKEAAPSTSYETDIPTDNGSVSPPANVNNEESIPTSGLMRIGNENTGYIDVPDHLKLLVNNSSDTMLTYNEGTAASSVQIIISVNFDYKNSPAQQKSPEEFADLIYSTARAYDRNSVKIDLETPSGTWWKVKYAGEALANSNIRYWAYYYTENNGNLYMVNIVTMDENSFAFRLIDTFDFYK